MQYWPLSPAVMRYPPKDSCECLWFILISFRKVQSGITLTVMDYALQRRLSDTAG